MHQLENILHKCTDHRYWFYSNIRKFCKWL